jgi:hypothetical protein
MSMSGSSTTARAPHRPTSMQSPGPPRVAYLLRLNSNVLAPGCTVNARPLVAVDA